jgi:hypothetical protein
MYFAASSLRTLCLLAGAIGWLMHWVDAAEAWLRSSRGNLRLSAE